MATPHHSNLLIRILANQKVLFDALSDIATDSDDKKKDFYNKLVERADEEERQLQEHFTES